MEVLAYLVEKTGRNYRPTPTTLKLIRKRLAEPGVVVEEVFKMIDRQCSRWVGSDMEQYLRPSTLFNAVKFDGYYAPRNLPVYHNHAGSKSLSASPPLLLEIKDL